MKTTTVRGDEKERVPITKKHTKTTKHRVNSNAKSRGQQNHNRASKRPFDELAKLVVELKITASREPEEISQIASRELDKLGKRIKK